MGCIQYSSNPSTRGGLYESEFHVMGACSEDSGIKNRPDPSADQMSFFFLLYNFCLFTVWLFISQMLLYVMANKEYQKANKPGYL